MYFGAERRFIRAILIAVGTVVTEGPVATFIRSWTPVGARVAWVSIGTTLAGLFYGSVTTAGRPVSRHLLVGCACLALVTVFVHLVRAELHRERELRALRLRRRG